MALAPITARPHVFNIRPAPGWLEVLFHEVEAIVKNPLQKYKFQANVTLLKSTVKLHRCDWRQGLEVLLRLTTAHDVEWVVLESKCSKWSEVDAILERVPWDEVLPSRDLTVHVTADVQNGFTSSSGKLRENLCKIAKVQHVSEDADIRFKIELRGEFLRISVSLAGAPLYKRGYKAKLSAVAPLPEHHAAACTRYVLANAESEMHIENVFVPFAGSGTFGFEALLVLSGSGNGAFNRKYACELFPCTPAPTIGFLKRKIAEKFELAKHPFVLFNDFNSEAVSVLKENASAFIKSGNFEVIEEDLFHLKPKFSESGKILVLLNPPYGNRLAKDSEVTELYGRLGIYLREIGKLYEGRVLGGCICPDEVTWKNFLHELCNANAKTHHFTHGGKEMRIVKWTN